MYLVLVKKQQVKKMEEKNILKLLSSKLGNFTVSSEVYEGLSNVEIATKLKKETSNSVVITPEDRLLSYREVFSISRIFLYDNGILEPIQACAKSELHPFSLPYREKVKGNISFPA